MTYKEFIHQSDEAKMSSFAEEKSHTRVVFVGNPFLIPVPRGDTVSYTLAKSLSLALSVVYSLHA